MIQPKKKYTKTINPFFYADEKVNDVDDTIDDMKDKGQWPDQASKESQQTVTQQLEKIDDLDAWNSWVEKANEEAENNPEDFKQNSEQNENSVFNKINKARQNFDPDFTVWMDTISRGRYEDTNDLFEPPEQVDYHIEDWFDDAHEQLMPVVKRWIEINNV